MAKHSDIPCLTGVVATPSVRRFESDAGRFDATMSTPRRDFETPAQYHNRLSDHCPMPLKRWRRLKGLAYSALIIALALIWLRWQGSPIVYASTVVAILLIQFVEIKEVQIMDAVSITLFPSQPRDTDDNDCE